MKLADLTKTNEISLDKIREFRDSASLDSSRPHNKTFHEFKNQHKFFGFVEIKVDGCEPFLMYSNNDDIVAMTYFWYGANSYERKSIEEWVKRIEGKKVILDVGSFTGLYSLAAACANKRKSNASIFAFEPTRRVYSRLLTNVQANELTRKIEPVEYAISNGISIVNFYQYRGEHILGNGASFIDKGISTTSSSELVQAVDLDWFVREHNISPDLMKIDVEQAEVLALEGMQQILSDAKPDIIIEVTEGTAQEVLSTLKRHSYKVFIIDEEAQKMIPFESGVCNKFVNLLAEHR